MVLEVPLSWLLEPVMTLEASFVVELDGRLVRTLFHFDFYAKILSTAVCLSFSPPTSNTKGEVEVVFVDVVVDVDVAIGFVPEASAVISFCYVVSGAMAESTVIIWMVIMKRIQKHLCDNCMALFLNRKL